MDKHELQRQYYELEKKFDANKTKRAFKVFVFYTLGIFLVWYLISRPIEDGIVGAAAMFVASIPISGILFLINTAVFAYLNNHIRIEENILNDLKSKIDAIDQNQ